MRAISAGAPAETARRAACEHLYAEYRAARRANHAARLLSLRRAWFGHPPALDGFVPDARLRFARWLVAQGHLSG